ncbi:hypothetical protein [Burkholderia gladioli]|uniref:hypothetical protein n=1 Tax=Burkholderia gladioli TaxID=28095 RepID=UPI00164097A7|nr:hypothetical protein [Burkholderia gladioli]
MFHLEEVKAAVEAMVSNVEHRAPLADALGALDGAVKALKASADEALGAATARIEALEAAIAVLLPAKEAAAPAAPAQGTDQQPAA